MTATAGTPIQALERIVATVLQQADDDGLWFSAETATEAYFQLALQKLHAVIEIEASPWVEIDLDD